jgi:hypothetical protein
VSRKTQYSLLYQVMERAWLIMAFMSSALSDHPLVRSNRANRHCVDRARKALFDLYKKFESEAEMIAAECATAEEKEQSIPTGLESEDDFGRRLLRHKGKIPQDIALEFGDGGSGVRSVRKRRRRNRG